MDKNLIKFFLLFFMLAMPVGHCAVFPDEFVSKFANCTPYFLDEGNRIRQLIGWGNTRCNYREIISKGVIDCQFKQDQVDEITASMQLDMPSPPMRVVYEDGEVKIYNTGWYSLDTWKKYINMKSACIPRYKDENENQE